MRTAKEQAIVDQKRVERAQSRLKSGLFQSLPAHLLPHRFKNYGPMIRDFRRDLTEAVREVHGPEIGFVLAEAIQMCVIHHQRHCLCWAMVKKEGTKLSPAEIERYLTVGERALHARHKVMVELGLVVPKVDDDGWVGFDPSAGSEYVEHAPEASRGLSNEMGADMAGIDESGSGDALGAQDPLSDNGEGGNHAGDAGGGIPSGAPAGRPAGNSAEEENPIW